ncbi:MAG TPA: DMT family transporter [Dongiaceae bacterium]|nr:DMT family transporter [Dongiaceae bacterium]
MTSPAIVNTPIKPLLAFVLMGTAVLCFSLVDATAKWLTQGYDPWQIAFLSRIVPIVVALIVAYRETGNPFNFYTKFPKVQILRAALTIPMIWCFFTGLKLMSLAEAITIAFTAPLFITMLSRPLLGEKIGPRRWGAVMIGFVGILVALRPGVGGIETGPILVIISAFAYALSMCLLRRFAGQEPTHNILFYSAIGAFLVGGFNSVSIWTQPDATDWGLLLLVGVWGVFGSYAVIRAYRLGEASMLAPLEYTALIWSMLFDLWLFHLTPIPAVLFGAAIVIASNVYIAHREHKIAKAAAQ